MKIMAAFLRDAIFTPAEAPVRRRRRDGAKGPEDAVRGWIRIKTNDLLAARTRAF
jgi:hypothetical protein